MKGRSVVRLLSLRPLLRVEESESPRRRARGFPWPVIPLSSGISYPFGGGPCVCWQSCCQTSSRYTAMSSGAEMPSRTALPSTAMTDRQLTVRHHDSFADLATEDEHESSSLSKSSSLVPVLRKHPAQPA